MCDTSGAATLEQEERREYRVNKSTLVKKNRVMQMDFTSRQNRNFRSRKEGKGEIVSLS